MIVTINTIDDKKEKLLAVCNITRNHGTLADVFAKASEEVCGKYPEIVVLSVNDDRKNLIRNVR